MVQNAIPRIRCIKPVISVIHWRKLTVTVVSSERVLTPFWFFFHFVAILVSVISIRNDNKRATTYTPGRENKASQSFQKEDGSARPAYETLTYSFSFSIYLFTLCSLFSFSLSGPLVVRHRSGCKFYSSTTGREALLGDKYRLGELLSSATFPL